MSYAVTDIILWSKICQPLAAVGEAKKKATILGSQEKSLDVELYITRKDVQYAYDQDPTSDSTFTTANYLLTLCGIYLFQAQTIAGGSGGSISPITAGATVPDPYEFLVASNSFIVTGATTKTITAFIGYNIIFVRNNITQSTVNNGGSYFSWNKATGEFVLLNGAAQLDELFQIYPII